MGVKIDLEAEYHGTCRPSIGRSGTSRAGLREEGDGRVILPSYGRAFWHQMGAACKVQWEKDGHVFEEYEPTAEENGDGMDYKWPDAEYIDGEESNWTA